MQDKGLYARGTPEASAQARAATARARGKAPDMTMRPLGEIPGGRSDDIPASLPHGGFMMPADVLAAVGDGSSNAGAERMQAAFPDLGPLPEGHPMQKAAVSRDEFLIDPRHVLRVGGGDHGRGTAALTSFRNSVRSRPPESVRK